MVPHATLRRPATTAPHLTGGEIQVLATIGAGLTFDAAARELGISDRTIRRRVRDVCDRVGVETTIEAVTWAARRGLI